MSDQIVAAKFGAWPKNVTFVQVYPPTEAANMTENKEFYALLAGWVYTDNIPRKQIDH